MPSTSMLHVDARLSQLSFLYSNELIGRYIGQEILPLVSVRKKSDKYLIYNKQDRFTLPNNKIGRKSQAVEVDWGTTDGSYDCEGYALEEFIPDEDFESADEVFDLMSDSTNDLTDKNMAIAEKRVADLVFSSSTITTGVTLSGTSQWNDYTNSDPISDLRTAINGTFIPANTLVLGYDVYEKLLDHPDFVERFIRNGSLANNASIIAEILDVDTVLIGKAKYNSANVGATPVYSRIWGKKALAFYRAPRPGKRIMSLGYTFSWTAAGGANGNFVTRRRDDARGLTGGEVVKVVQSVDEKVTAVDVGYLITDAVA